MIELNAQNLALLDDNTPRFTYDRAKVQVGIVHLSVGNFHRSHQAWYIDRVLAEPENTQWGICGVSLLDTEGERAKRDLFPKQNNLYTLTRYDQDGGVSRQVIGALVDFMFAPQNPEAVIERMAMPQTHIVSLTITEGGYNQTPGSGLYNLDNPATQAELRDPKNPVSAFGYIIEALRRRRERGVSPFTVMSCDNLRHNGRIAQSAVLSHARALDPEFASWIQHHVAFPNSMVDRITPATSDEVVATLRETYGVNDHLPVISESFSQWVIEEHFCGTRPPLEKVGVQFVSDVGPYELAKTRMLNAAHSMLAYPAQLAGMENVFDAISNADLRRLVDDFLICDVIPTLQAPEGMDLEEYHTLIIKRFHNARISDQLARITGDGRSKLPTFIAPTLLKIVERGGKFNRIAFNIACFLRYLRGVTDDGVAFDPFEPQLNEEQRSLAFHSETALDMEMFRDFNLQAEPALVDLILTYDSRMREEGTLRILARVIRGEL